VQSIMTSFSSCLIKSLSLRHGVIAVKRDSDWVAHMLKDDKHTLFMHSNGVHGIVSEHTGVQGMPALCPYASCTCFANASPTARHTLAS
jgi:hypothetical protein